MSKWVDITGISIPSDENNYDELIVFADAIAELDPIDMETIKTEAYNRGIDSERKRIADAWCKAEYERGYKDGRESADRPQGEWIPCSERLPKKEEATYLICTETGHMCSCRWTNDMYGLGSNEWSKWGWHIMDKPQYAKVVAWMPLKPWRGADDE